MIEGREQARLALEPADPVGIVRERRGQDFHGDVALEARIGRAIDLAHPACAQERPQTIDA